MEFNQTNPPSTDLPLAQDGEALLELTKQVSAVEIALCEQAEQLDAVKRRQEAQRAKLDSHEARLKAVETP